MHKIYILSFDPYKTNAGWLHEVIKSSPYITNWWHYLGSTYVIKSSYTLATVQNDIIARWPNQHFLLMEVNAQNYAGWLPKVAWDWIDQNR